MPNVSYIGCSSSNYTAGRSGWGVDHVVIHYTGTQASAYNNGVYFSRPGANASAHYFVDGSGTIIRSVNEGNTAWHAGDWIMNCRSIGIEVVSDGRDFSNAEINELAWLVQDICKRYNIPASRVIRHYDVTGKHCPAPYVNNSKWSWLKNEILTRGQYVKPVQNLGKAKNSWNVCGQAHIADVGWRDRGRDGQNIGTTGYGAPLEAMRLDISNMNFGKDKEIEFKITPNIQYEGETKTYTVKKSNPDQIIGTTGKSRRFEGAAFVMTKNTTGKRFYLQFHTAGIGWGPAMEITSNPRYLGSEGFGRAIEAFRFWAA